MITKISSTYPIWLPADPKEKTNGMWLNLANVECVSFDKKKKIGVVHLTSGEQGHITQKDFDLISDEFRAICEERRSPPNREEDC